MWKDIASWSYVDSSQVHIIYAVPSFEASFVVGILFLLHDFLPDYSDVSHNTRRSHYTRITNKSFWAFGRTVHQQQMKITLMKLTGDTIQGTLSTIHFRFSHLPILLPKNLNVTILCCWYLYTLLYYVRIYHNCSFQYTKNVISFVRFQVMVVSTKIRVFQDIMLVSCCQCSGEASYIHHALSSPSRATLGMLDPQHWPIAISASCPACLGTSTEKANRYWNDSYILAWP